MITHIDFENYRIFKQRQQLEIKPVTIIFGKNNSGKSALLKLPLLVENLFKASRTKIVSQGNNGVILFNEYRDMIYGRATNEAKFAVRFDDGETETVGFHVDGNKMAFASYNHDGHHSMNMIDYIGPIRLLKPGLDMRISSEEIRLSGIDGASMYQVLLRDAVSDEQSVSKKVEQWYSENFDGWRVKVDKSLQPVYNIVMSYDGLKTPICDCGTGIIQSLPIVVRACWPCLEPTLIILEEPETHLNPSAHANLCQLIAESAQSDGNKKYLIETHSQTFILRLQRLLAEGKLNVEDVAIYFVHFDEQSGSSSLNRVEMNSDGSIPDWPAGMFSEVLEEALAINNTRYKE